MRPPAGSSRAAAGGYISERNAPHAGCHGRGRLRFPTLLRKELLRFWKVSFQTIAAPVITALLYLLVFAQVLQDRVHVYGTVPYTSFLIPGLMMMSMLQNAFANPSSSLIQSRITGNLVFILLPPLSHRDIYFAYVIAAITRGIAVGPCVWIVALVLHPAGRPRTRYGCWSSPSWPAASWAAWASSPACSRRNSTSWPPSRIS